MVGLWLNPAFVLGLIPIPLFAMEGNQEGLSLFGKKWDILKNVALGFEGRNQLMMLSPAVLEQVCE